MLIHYWYLKKNLTPSQAILDCHSTFTIHIKETSWLRLWHVANFGSGPKHDHSCHLWCKRKKICPQQSTFPQNRENLFTFSLKKYGEISDGWVADDVTDDVSEFALRWLVNLNSGLRPKLSRLVSVFGLSERLVNKLKWPIGRKTPIFHTPSSKFARSSFSNPFEFFFQIFNRNCPSP